MNLSFENKIALVTGADSGIGLATAKAFAEPEDMAGTISNALERV
jgi:NAD(P)-dependent dehydrogenase (short-subunit alcohol dehydrogenase family)